MSSHVMQPDASLLPPLSDGLLREPAFPILTLDESRLTPALGYIFRRGWIYPHESKSGPLAHCYDGAAAGRLDQRLLRVAGAGAIKAVT